MKRFLHILSLVFTLTLLVSTGATAATAVRETAADLKHCPIDAAQRKDALYEIRGSQQSHEAVLDNTQNTLRTSTTRPTRLLPTHGGTPNQPAAQQTPHHTPILHHYGLSLRARPTLPIRPCASAHYYVLQLRHIIR